jgi:4-amino-4-deoxy-L-arabinose transferase-like glycosyltransferase
MRSWLRRSWPALALALLALALRCYGLTAPLLDYHSWRQADTAAIARNYATNGYHLFYPQVDWGGTTPGYVESEFPLYTYTLALLYGLFGVREWLGRMLTALASAGAVVALYGLVRSGQGSAGPGERAALYAGLALALMPFPIYFGRTVMPDTWMLLAAILAIWTYQRWLERPSAGRYAVAVLCGALAPLAKTPNLLIVAVPLAYLTWTARPPRRDWPALAGYAVYFVLPSLLWLGHARTLPLDPRLSFGIGEKLFDPRLLRDPQFYLLLARWSVVNVITLAGLPFLIIGLLPRGSDRRLLRLRFEPSTTDDRLPTTIHPLTPHAWLLGVLLFLYAGAAGVVGQDYYVLPLAGPAAWLVGLGIDRTQRFLETTDDGRRTTDDGPTKQTQKIADRRPKIASHHPLFAIRYPQRLFRPSSFVLRRRWISYLVPILALAALAALSLNRVAPLYQTTDFYRTLGRRVNLALPDGARVGVIAPAVSEILYYGGRKGWRLDPGVLVPGGLASLPPDLGVRYLLITDPALTEQRDLLTVALRDYRRIPAGPYALLLDLARPGPQRSAILVWETGHLVEEPFLNYWRKAGVERLGYPLSDSLDGPEGHEQYFERGLLLRKGDHITRAPVGRLLLGAQGRTPLPSAVAEPFWAAWEHAGGEDALGMALSPPVDDGAGGQIQYFEYGTLELPAGGTVALGAAGRRLLDARGLTEERQIELLRDTGDREQGSAHNSLVALSPRHPIVPALIVVCAWFCGSAVHAAIEP